MEMNCEVNARQEAMANARNWKNSKKKLIAAQI